MATEPDADADADADAGQAGPGDDDRAGADAGAAEAAPDSVDQDLPDEPAVNPQVRVRPEQTSDDTDAGWGERRDESGHDRWLREQRPPHWE